ncbi:MAG: alpha/beta fold hydrolase [Verrucomicrobiota bacterium]
MTRLLLSLAATSLVCFFHPFARAQAPLPSAPPPPAAAVQDQVKELHEALRYAKEELTMRIDDVQWFRRFEELAVVDKVYYTSSPARVTNNPTAQGAGNPLIIPAYSFLPKKSPAEGKFPLLVLVHGGVHGDFRTPDEFHTVRELIEQGYAIIAPEYRGSTGYGKDYWEKIDYGALENEDVLSGKQWMLENHPEVDADRVGILGWSHGGMITLMNIFEHPTDYKVAYAGVPVSDLVARMGYKSQTYRDLFSAPYYIGKTAEENVAEYRRRSPAWNAEKLQTPLLIHTTTNDEDVNVLEVEHLVQALKAAGKNFDYKVYTNAPGGHAFNRLDTRLAKESRAEIYRFLAKYLNPPNPVK